MTVEQRSLAAPAGSEDRLRDLVFTFYERVRDDELLGPVFESSLAGRWEAANDILPPLEAADIVARSKRMRVVLERSTQPCPASETRRRPTRRQATTHD